MGGKKLYWPLQNSYWLTTKTNPPKTLVGSRQQGPTNHTQIQHRLAQTQPINQDLAAGAEPSKLRRDNNKNNY